MSLIFAPLAEFNCVERRSTFRRKYMTRSEEFKGNPFDQGVFQGAGEDEFGPAKSGCRPGEPG
jgi:hypothetical protein